jgi:hypothetical protein
MNTTYEPLITTIPDDIRAKIAALRATDVGFGAGPGFCAGKFHTYPEAVALDEALTWIERYRQALRRAHARLEDGSVLWFEPSGFVRHQAPGKRRDLSPGIVIVHPAGQ